MSSRSGLLDNYIHMLKLRIEQSETMLELICAIIHEKVDGDDYEKRLFIKNIKRIDPIKNPDKLRELIENTLKPTSVRVWDEDYGSVLGWRNYKFSLKFKRSLEKVLYRKEKL